jgi:CBS domain-containing protein
MIIIYALSTPYMSLNLSLRVKAAMNRDMVTVESEDSIKAAIRKMVRGNMGSVVITDGGKPIGMLTERDILRSIAYKRVDPDSKVGEIMSKPLISIDSVATVGEAAEMMIKNKVRRLMVKENGKYVGIITQRDLQRLMTDTFKSLLLY